MPTKTCQLDVILTDKLKKVLEGCLPAWTHIINKLLDTSQFCNEWKEPLVKPMIKKSTAGWEKSNYSPVCNLSFISKIAEKVTLIQFAKHCDENRLLSTYQSAYRRNHSYKTSLVKLVDDLLWALEEQLVTAVVILDLSAAFDTVDHDLLLEVLEKEFGVTNNTKQWYCNYIKPRRFRVIIGKNKSEPRQLDYSVPQGSIQGTFLFISYASTLDEIVKDLTLNGFADDHSVRKTFKPSWLEHKQELNTTAVIEKSMLDIKSDGCSMTKDEWQEDKIHLFQRVQTTKKMYYLSNKCKWRTNTKEPLDKIPRSLSWLSTKLQTTHQDKM